MKKKLRKINVNELEFGAYLCTVFLLCYINENENCFFLKKTDCKETYFLKANQTLATINYVTPIKPC